MTMTIMVPGPLHPDLFGGMTPIMTPVKGRAFLVRAAWVARDYTHYTVVAADDAQAEEIAARLVEREHHDARDMEFATEELFNPGCVSAHDAEVSQKILEEINAEPTPTTFGRTR